MGHSPSPYLAPTSLAWDTSGHMKSGLSPSAPALVTKYLLTTRCQALLSTEETSLRPMEMGICVRGKGRRGPKLGKPLHWGTGANNRGIQVEGP